MKFMNSPAQQRLKEKNSKVQKVSYALLVSKTIPPGVFTEFSSNLLPLAIS